jgi:predicted phosphate transport protein (TIGR00153 family)
VSVLDRLFGKSPFGALVEHTTKVHECVELVRPLVDALLREDFERIGEIQDQMSKTEYEADLVKTEIRKSLSKGVLLAVNRNDLSRYLAYQDDVADAAEDFAVVLSLRRTVIHEDLKADLRALSDQVIKVSEIMLSMANDLMELAHEAFSGQRAEKVLQGTKDLGEEEWKADRMQRRFARRCYEIEDQLKPMDLVFYDKICQTLSAIANKAENTGKFLQMLIAHR